MKNFHYPFLLFLLLILQDCASSLKLEAVPKKPEVQKEAIHQMASNATYALKGFKYRFPTPIEGVDYNPEWQQLALNFKDAKNKRPHYGIYNIEKDQLNWMNKGDYSLSMIKKDVTLIRKRDKGILLETENGLPIRPVDRADFVLVDDSIALKIGERVERVDLRTGEIYWKRPRFQTFDGWLTDEIYGDWMYIMANGLHGFNLATGEGWFKKANTNYDATLGGRVPLNGALFGFNFINPFEQDAAFLSPLGPIIAHNIYAKPVVEQDNLYFADRLRIYSIDRKTGDTHWQQKIKQQTGISEITFLTDQKLLFLGKGYRFVNYLMDKEKTAIVLLMNARNGRVINHINLPEGEIIVNHAISDTYIYLLSEHAIYQYDYRLSLINHITLPENFGTPLRVVTWSSAEYDKNLQTGIPDFPLVIRTMKGVIGLYPVSLDKLWYQHLGTINEKEPTILSIFSWQIPIFMQEQDLRRSWVDEETEIFWFAKSKKIIGLDLLNNGAKVAEFDMPSDDFWYVDDGKLVQFGDQEVQILHLEAN